MMSKDLTAAFSRNKRFLALCMSIGLAIAGVSYRFIPKKFKIMTTLALETSYFQMPLVSGFLPETYDPQELRSQREALIHRALNHDFLENLDQRYHLVTRPADATGGLSTYEIELLGKRFEIIPQGASSFSVSFMARDPELGYSVIQDFVGHLKKIMLDERRARLLDLHDAIQDQLESISYRPGEADGAMNPFLSTRPELLQHRARKIQEEIETLKTTYSEKHPKVAELKRQLELLSSWSTPHHEASAHPAQNDVFADIHVDAASKDLFDDLLRKYRYLEVVLYMDQENKNQYLSMLAEPFVPLSPVWPKLPMLMAWGLAAGFLLGSAWIMIRDVYFLPKLQTDSVRGESRYEQPLPLA